jgi:hypothetical protein
VKIVVRVRLFPDAAQQAALRATLDLCNTAADLASAEAFERRVFAKQSLQRLTYGRLKGMGLSAQPAIQVARKVAGAYATLKANIRAGNLGKPDSKRRQAAEGKPIQFRRDAAQPYDDRCLSWQLADRTVSIWAVGGRLNKVPFACSDASTPRWPRTARANPTWCAATARGTCTPPATSRTSRRSNRTGSSASTWASPISPPPATAPDCAAKD